jgi:hypothetical protein
MTTEWGRHATRKPGTQRAPGDGLVERSSATVERSPTRITLAVAHQRGQQVGETERSARRAPDSRRCEHSWNDRPRFTEVGPSNGAIRVWGASREAEIRELCHGRLVACNEALNKGSLGVCVTAHQTGVQGSNLHNLKTRNRWQRQKAVERFDVPRKTISCAWRPVLGVACIWSLYVWI